MYLIERMFRYFSEQQDKILIKKIILKDKNQLQFAVPTQKRSDAALKFLIKVSASVSQGL